MGLHGSPDPIDNQLYRIFRVEHDDGTITDYEYPCYSYAEIAGAAPSAARAQDQALWLTFEHLFRGTMPGKAKAVQILAQWTGASGSEPPG